MDRLRLIDDQNVDLLFTFPEIWNQSDVLNNSLRDILAEYIVASLLLNKTIEDWNTTSDGNRIQVKSATYFQSLYQNDIGQITFDLKPALAWNPIMNTYTQVETLRPEVYVFCLLKQNDPTLVDPFNLDNWEFYVLSQIELSKNGLDQRISLNSILKLNYKLVNYDALAEAISSLK